MGKQIISWEFFVRQWLLCQLQPIWSICEATGNGLFIRPYIFYAHVLYRDFLISLQSSALGLVISRKNTKVEAFFTKKNLARRWLTWPLPVKFQQSMSVNISCLISINSFFILSYDFRDPEAKYSRKDLPLISKFSCICFGTDQILVRQWYGSKLRGSSLENYTGNGEAPLWKFMY